MSKYNHQLRRNNSTTIQVVTSQKLSIPIIDL